jgi:thiol:disulfide interchange protein DsbC
MRVTLSALSATLFVCFIFIVPYVRADADSIAKAILASPVLNPRFGYWSVAATIVPGIYALQPPSGRFAPAFMEEDLKRVGTLRGWQAVTADGLTMLDKDAQREIRRGLLKRLDWSQGIRTVYGNGTRKVIFFSAFDCPNCRRFEERLQREGKALDATVYLFPQALAANDPRAAAIVHDVWCARDPHSSWLSMILRRQRPAPARGGCRRSNTQSTELSDMLGVQGVPALVTEDGRVLQGFVKTPMTAISARLMN